MLIVSDVVRADLVLALLLTTEQSQIYPIVTLLSAAGTFFNLAANATLPTLLDADDLLAANAEGHGARLRRFSADAHEGLHYARDDCFVSRLVLIDETVIIWMVTSGTGQLFDSCSWPAE